MALSAEQQLRFRRAKAGQDLRTLGKSIAISLGSTFRISSVLYERESRIVPPELSSAERVQQLVIGCSPKGKLELFTTQSECIPTTTFTHSVTAEAFDEMPFLLGELHKVELRYVNLFYHNYMRTADRIFSLSFSNREDPEADYPPLRIFLAPAQLVVAISNWGGEFRKAVDLVKIVEDLHCR
ncbi:hypothetical protein HY988_01615 [Candidatus Micrarchaeota archaeon]|nr:hypothetical protein [Candidatus Micrarchaeota archaeon]